MALAVMAAGLWMLSGLGGFGGLPLTFPALWIIIGLGGAAAFYNAFRRRGLPLYEIDVDADAREFCRHCWVGC